MRIQRRTPVINPLFTYGGCGGPKYTFPFPLQGSRMQGKIKFLKFSFYAPMSDRDTEDGGKIKISQYKARVLRGETI